MRKAETTNSFEKGLISDFNPISTPNNTYTNALNATLLTMNGNENVIQCDMGNGRVETAYLPQGYIPLGTAQLGGIIYIASYNPLTNKSQIGSFPSPERNITTDDSTGSNISLVMSQFTDGTVGEKYPKVKFPTKLIELSNIVLNPGDKFQIGINRTDLLSAVGSTRYNPDDLPRQLKLNVVAVQDDGTINNLNHSLTWNDGYYMMPIGKLDKLSDYRDLIHSNYSIFNSKVSGKLAILAQLEAINSFDVSWDANKEANGWKFSFSLNWTYENSTSPSGRNITGIIVDYGDGTTEFIEVPVPNGRKNDGTDDDIIVTGEHYVNSAGSKTITVYPVMDFGALDYLKQSFTIDIDKLGTGQIDLKEYRYFYNTKKIVLNWGLEAYPEKNKKIESVIFDFQKYKGGITDNIDDTKWEIVDGKATSNGQPDFTSEHSIEVKKTSFSGNFTTDITQLEDDKLYVVRITIKYTGKDIVYYRLMYTCSIFNKYYFKEDDFAKIVLGDEIPEIISYTTQNEVSTNYENPKLMLNGNEVESIDKYILDGTTDTSRLYQVEHKYTKDITSTIIPTSKYSVFTPQVKITDAPSSSKYTLTPNTKEQYIDRANGHTNKPDNFQIEYDSTSPTMSIKDDTVKTTINQTIKTPINVSYSLSAIDVPYKLENLNIGLYWILITGAKQWINIGVSDSYTNETLGGTDKFGDNDDGTGRQCHELGYYVNTYSDLENRLKSHDMLVVGFTCSRMTSEKDPGGNQGIRAGYHRTTGNISGGDNASANYRRMFPIRGKYADGDPALPSGNDKNYFMPIYITKNANSNSLSLFTFNGINSDDISGGSDSTWYNETKYRGWSDPSYVIKGEQPLAFATGSNVIPNIQNFKKQLEAQFQKLYKSQKNPNQANVNTWQTIWYFDDYQYSENINFKQNLELILNCNGDVLLDNNNVPKNINYINSNTNSKDITISLNDIERVYQYVNTMLNTTSNKSLVMLPNNKGIREIAITDKVLYDENGNEQKYLKKDRGNQSDISLMQDSNIEVSYSDQVVKINPGKIEQNNQYVIGGNIEEQWIFVTNVFTV